jgi:hypothetical protein
VDHRDQLSHNRLAQSPHILACAVTFRSAGDEPADAGLSPLKVPRLGILGVFRLLVPNTYFWFAADPPHTWIRYEGPENRRGTPEITIEPAG